MGARRAFVGIAIAASVGLTLLATGAVHAKGPKAPKEAMLAGGGDRPARVLLPPDYKPGHHAPLIMLLHGFAASSNWQDRYLAFSERAARAGNIVVLPDGSRNHRGQRFWNSAPGWCCDFDGQHTDDTHYLLALLDEAEKRFAVDLHRVYLVGHSNGGFMAHTLACVASKRIAAIVSIAGSMPPDEDDCKPTHPVSVLQVHGTDDEVIPYAGTDGMYPGAAEIALRWSKLDGCKGAAIDGEPRDYDRAVDGAETTPSAHRDCRAHSEVELWTMSEAAHIPTFHDAFVPDLLAWLAAHPKKH